MREKSQENVSKTLWRKKLTRYFTTAIDSLKHSIILHFSPAIFPSSNGKILSKEGKLDKKTWRNLQLPSNHKM